MNVHILHLASDAEKARGLAVIIDVFRAFSVVCYLFDRGVAKIIAVQDIDLAFELRQRDPRIVLVGERHALKIPGFDYGNSPTEILEADLGGRSVVHTTHAGTQALLAAGNAKDIITGSFVNAGAIVRYIKSAGPSEISLVCAGFEGRLETLEDTLCAEYLQDLLGGRSPDFEAIRERIRRSDCSRRFLHPTERTCPQKDLDLCLDLDRFGFVVRRTEMHHGHCVLQRLDI